ncbi:MAG: DUF1697 domain-containing protein [Candidatus Polarisedimenticolia bacterium]
MLERAGPVSRRKHTVADRRVALLRGINVGRAKRIAMADLRALFAALGYDDVRTLLNSGNVVFSVPKPAREDPAPRIEKAMASKLGVPSRVIVLTADEVAVAVDRNPLRKLAVDPSRLQLMVLAHPGLRSGLTALAKQSWTPEALAAGARVDYLWCPAGTIAGRLMPAVNRVVGDLGTVRNLATMTKLSALMAGE